MSVTFGRARGALATGAMAILCVGSVSADLLRVPQDFARIQWAIDAANDGDEIIVAAGTYSEAIDFKGKAVNLRSADGASSTIIDATGFDTSTVTCASAEGSDTILDGFTITGGLGRFEEGYGWERDRRIGCQMYVVDASPTVKNCMIAGPVKLDSDPLGALHVRGGGMYCLRAGPSVTDCVFHRNGVESEYFDPSAEGAGMYNEDSQLRIANCTYDQNVMSGYEDWALSGGGMYNKNTSVRIDQCVFEQNGDGIFSVASSLEVVGSAFHANGWVTAESQGGWAIVLFEGGDLSVTNSEFTENWGGGIAGVSGAVITDCVFESNHGTGLSAGGGTTVTGCVFRKNDAYRDFFESYGAGLSVGGNVVVRDCQFIENQVAGHGGGLCVGGGTPTIQNCLFARNIATVWGHGGGVYVGAGSPTIVNCLFTRNTATTGDGLYNEDGSGLRIINCTFAEDGVANKESGAAIRNTIIWPGKIEGDAMDVAYSDIQGGYAGEGNIDLAPDFADPDNGDFRLLNGSPCIDAGDNTAVPDGVTTDLDGKRRFEDDPATEDTGNGAPPVVDMGAYELPHQWIDCNGNGIDDLQEIVDGTSPDCNANEVPDECDIADGTSLDVVPPGGNGNPDECESIHNVTRDTYFSRIQFALNAAADGDEIVVAAGTYHEAINFWGKAAYLHSADGPATTFIDGNGLDSSVVTFKSGEGAGAIIEGFTITGGAGTLSDGARRGGAVYVSNSSPTLIKCIFSENVVGGADAEGFGGGVYVVSGSPTMIRCAFQANRAKGGANRGLGGGMFNDGSSPVLIHCTFDGNTVASFGLGGGMANANRSSPRIDGCLFVRNEALAGGALLNSDSSHALVTGCTFTQNSAGSRGGAVYNMFDSFPTLTNVILWDDFPDEIARDPANVTYSNVQGGYEGTGNIDADPLFVDPGTGNFRLTADSPCIDAGDPNFAAPPGATDRDGHLRIWDGDGDGAAIVDMGVYEFGSFAYGDLNCDGGVDFDDVDAFVVALTGKEYEKNYPDCDYQLADINGDASVDFDDIDGFIDCLVNGGCERN